MAEATRLKRSAVTRGPERTPVRLFLNGEGRELSLEPRRTLLDVLRKELGLTGAKKGCDEGTCGACTVLVDGRPIYACLTLAIECEGREIKTVEGLARDSQLHPVQEAFIEHDALQCGFCTPGQVLAVVALIEAHPNPTEAEVKRALSGNLCRCGAYPALVRAALAAAKRLCAE